MVWRLCRNESNGASIWLVVRWENYHTFYEMRLSSFHDGANPIFIEKRHPTISIPQRSDLNEKLIHFRLRKSTISIPQRSDLNSTATTWWSCRTRNFNPATVWFEPLWFIPEDRSLMHFNPATVWFEHIIEKLFWQSFTHFNPATVWFEPLCVAVVGRPQTVFQSRNGLIWTLVLMKLCYTILLLIRTQRSDLNSSIDEIIVVNNNISIPQRSDLNTLPRKCACPSPLNFNPATVWFEHDGREWYPVIKQYFNPATVWFELWCTAYDSAVRRISIPQRSDLNSDPTSSEGHEVNVFQSRNGLIWTGDEKGK